MEINDLILYTSGSTDEPKEVVHDGNTVRLMIERSIKELELTPEDTVLNVLPSNVIGYYAILGLPAIMAGSKLVTMQFDPYLYLKAFNKHRPTIAGLIPRMIEILQHTKGFETLDMSCCRYFVMGSQKVPKEMVDLLLKKGVKTVVNWYGSTEHPPPVFVATNGSNFDLKPRVGYTVAFDNSECIINDAKTGDIFDVTTGEFLHRKAETINKTWKS